MAKTILYELTAKFTGDITGLQKSLGAAESSLNKFAGVVAKVAGPAALGAFFVSQAKLIDGNREMAASLGVSYKAFVDMSLVAREAGVDIGALAASFSFMQRAIFDATNGAQPLIDSFSRIGISAKDIINLSPDKQFEIIAQALSKIENPAERAAVGQDLLGRGFRQLIPVIEDYSNKIKDASDFNERFGLSFSDEDAAKVDNMTDSLNRAIETLKGLAQTVVVDAAPAIEGLAKAFAYLTENIKIGINWFTDWVALTTARTGTIFNPELRRIIDEQQKNGDPFANEPMRITVYPENKKSNYGSASDQNKTMKEILGVNEMQLAREKLDDLRQAWEENRRVAQQFGDDTGSIFAGFVNSVFSGESALDSLKKKALDVLSSIVESMFQLSFGGSGGGGFAGMIASALFGAFGFGGGLGAGYNPATSPPPTKPFAKGGAFLNSSTMFPMSTGMGVAGEAGPEAIMPLVRGPGGKLGISASGGSPSIVQNLNFSVGVQQTVRAEILRLMPQIKAASLEGVQDASNRGSFKPA